VPVKSFRAAKLRLAPVLKAEARADLARDLALGVLAAAGKLEPFVVCDDDEVARWAEATGAGVIWTPGLGLSGAVAAGVEQLCARGIEVVVVAHADLPYAEELDKLAMSGCVTLVPDLARDGTNVAVVPSRAGFRFAYGKGSFGRHRAEAARLGLPCVVVHDRRLGADLDLPADLARLERARTATRGRPSPAPLAP